jgi:hypothetical protein
VAPASSMNPRRFIGASRHHLEAGEPRHPAIEGRSAGAASSGAEPTDQGVNKRAVPLLECDHRGEDLLFNFHYEPVRLQRAPDGGGGSNEARGISPLLADLPMNLVENKHRHKPSAVHSMTASARRRMAGGIVRPSAFAVFRLITSSNFVGCWAGVSAGRAPFSILSIRAARIAISSPKGGP